MAEKTYNISDFKLSTSWTYTVDTDDQAGIRHDLTSGPNSVSTTKTVDIGGDIKNLSTINSITISWTYSSKLATSAKVKARGGWNASYSRVYPANGSYDDGVNTTESNCNATSWIDSDGKLKIKFYYDPSPTRTIYDDSSTATTTTNTGTISWSNIIITVDYTPYTTLSTPLVDTKTVTIKSDDTVTLSWTASTAIDNGDNTVSYYQIYMNGQVLEEGKVYPPELSYDFTCSKYVNFDSSAIFTIKAISSEPGYDSAVSNGVTVQCYKKFDMPKLYLYTSKKATQAEMITVGFYDQPTITAIWDINGLGGNYDSIDSITFKEGNNLAETLFTDSDSTTVNSISSNTEYTLTITMKSGYSGTSTATANIATVGDISFTSASTGTVGSSTTYSWSEASGATDYYFYLDGDIGDYSGTTTSTSINQNISNYVSNGHSFTFTIYPRVNASYGGYTQGTGIVASQIRATKPAINGNISITGDTNVPSAYTYAYNTVNINITNASSYSRVIINASTQTSAIKDFTNNSAATLSTSHNISSISEGTSITYTIKLYNSYGEESEYTYTIVRFQRPTVTITGVSATSKTATINFKITPSPHSASGNTYYYPEISYGGQTTKKENVLITKYSNETSVLVYIDFSKESSLRSDLSILYDALRGANDLPIGRPTLSFNIVVYDNNIGPNFSNRASSSYNQVIDYRAYPTNSELIVSSSPTYPSSKDTITLTSSASITDAVGNTDTRGLIYNITRTNPYATFTGASVDDVLGTINSDTTYTYELVVSKQYKDGNASATANPVSIKVYRFVPPSFTVSNLRWEQNKLMGTINISDLGGSEEEGIENIDYYEYSVNDFDNDSHASEEINEKNKDYSNNGDIEHDFSNSSYDSAKEVYLSVTIKTYSKTGKTQETTLGTFLVKPSGIPFSIRKNGVGVHVEANFNPDTSDAAFKVIGNSDTDTIVEFENGNGKRNSNVLLNSNGAKMYLSLQYPENGEPYFTIIFE